MTSSNSVTAPGAGFIDPYVSDFHDQLDGLALGAEASAQDGAIR
jgi:hypothetical protein